MGWRLGIKKERGHLVRQRASPAQVHAKAPYMEVVRAARSSGQDVRAPTPLQGIEIDDLAIVYRGIN